MKALSFILVSIRFVSFVAAYERRSYGGDLQGWPSPQTEDDSTTPQPFTSKKVGPQSPGWDTAETSYTKSQETTTSCTTTESVCLPLFYPRELNAL